MENGLPVKSSRTLDTMTFGEVPTRVTMPPRSEAKAIGMRKDRWRTISCTRKLECNRHEHRERADIFHDSREHADGDDERDHLCLRVRQVRLKMAQAASKIPDRAIAALTIRALPTIMTIVGEALEHFLGGNDADRNAGDESRGLPQYRSVVGPRA